jgi:hypothetical protein
MIRLHVPAIPYTITRDEFSHDAFTGKVKRFGPMMRSRGFEVYHYGVETSESGATQNFDILTKAEWTRLRIETLQYLNPKMTLEEATAKNESHTMIVNDLSNWGSPLSKEFNRRFREKLIANYRSSKTDIVCIPLSRTYQDALQGLNYATIEFGIGYSGSYLDFRIFESHAWLSHTLGRENRQPHNYWFVIPHGFDTTEFKLSLSPKKRKIGFLGRIVDLKGCGIIQEVARRFPMVEFVLCGQGDPASYLTTPNITYKPPIHGTQRSDFFGDCEAVLYPVKYLEPFGCGPVEAQLCGTPVICSDWGGMVETVEQGKTGLRCHTLADYCRGVQMALDGAFDRTYVRERAIRLYDMYKLAPQYEYVFRSVLDIYTPEKNGWYSPDSHMIAAAPNPEKPLIYLFIVYYGSFPNYFQLYLDSLAINQDILRVVLVTDIDLSPYTVPANLIHIRLSLEEVRTKMAAAILDLYGKEVDPANLVTAHYKLVDFKIMFPYLFHDLVPDLRPTDYVGWGDCDVIYGKLSHFIDFSEGYELLGGYHGHFTAIRNRSVNRDLFLAVPKYVDLLTDNSKSFITDEIAFRKPLVDYIDANKYKLFIMQNHMCDIVPPNFYHIFRPDYATHAKNFFNVTHPKKNISHLYYDKTKLMLTYDGGETVETAYCHLQKRDMELPFTDYKDGYYICEHAFSIEKASSS